MHAKTATVALALLVSSAVAQSNGTSTVDISTIDIGTKTSWCNAEYDSCNFLCGNPKANSCDNDKLVFECLCANNSQPGLEYYIQTIPTFLCEQEFDQCIQANLQNSSGQDVCKATRKKNCGQLVPNKVVRPEPSSSEDSSPSSTRAASGPSDTATPTDSVSSGTSSAAAATMLALGREYGSGVIVAGVALAMMI